MSKGLPLPLPRPLEEVNAKDGGTAGRSWLLPKAGADSAMKGRQEKVGHDCNFGTKKQRHLIFFPLHKWWINVSFGHIQEHLINSMLPGKHYPSNKCGIACAGYFFLAGIVACLIMFILLSWNKSTTLRSAYLLTFFSFTKQIHVFLLNPRMDSASNDALNLLLEFVNWKKLPLDTEEILSDHQATSTWVPCSHFGKQPANSLGYGPFILCCKMATGFLS